MTENPSVSGWTPPPISDADQRLIVATELGTYRQLLADDALHSRRNAAAQPPARPAGRTDQPGRRGDGRHTAGPTHRTALTARRSDGLPGRLLGVPPPPRRARRPERTRMKPASRQPAGRLKPARCAVMLWGAVRSSRPAPPSATVRRHRLRVDRRLRDLPVRPGRRECSAPPRNTSGRIPSAFWRARHLGAAAHPLKSEPS